MLVLLQFNLTSCGVTNSANLSDSETHLRLRSSLFVLRCSLFMVFVVRRCSRGVHYEELFQLGTKTSIFLTSWNRSMS